jgi:hypothetical protein
MLKRQEPEHDWKWHVARAEEALEAASMSGLPSERIKAHTERARGHIELARELRSLTTLRELNRYVAAKPALDS